MVWGGGVVSASDDAVHPMKLVLETMGLPGWYLSITDTIGTGYCPD